MLPDIQPGNTKILYFFNCLLDGMHTKKQKYALFSYYFSLLDSKQTASTWPVEGNISTG